MNLLAHLRLAERTRTSSAGQILGDMIKGRLDEPLFGRFIDDGIRLHRRIDAFSDAHAAHRRMRQCFEPPLRRYAGILVDIGFDHALALHWQRYHNEALAGFATRAERQVITEWPARAPCPARRMLGLAAILSGYVTPTGITRALVSVSNRLVRENPIAGATDTVVDLQPMFASELEALMPDLEIHVADVCDALRRP